ncbi:MAG: hypothetical protein KIT72_07525 [Polyangiaceae bacterium]|nr:hypothetical protein [Polyangiaceae bacterium]
MRKIRMEAEARRCLAQVEASGRSLAGWARAHGVDVQSLYGWRRALKRHGDGYSRVTGEGVSPPQFVELVAAPEGRDVPDTAARYVVCLEGARIEVDDSFRADTLARLVRALRAC